MDKDSFTSCCQNVLGRMVAATTEKEGRQDLDCSSMTSLASYMALHRDEHHIDWIREVLYSTIRKVLCIRR